MSTGQQPGGRDGDWPKGTPESGSNNAYRQAPGTASSLRHHLILRAPVCTVSPMFTSHSTDSMSTPDRLSPSSQVSRDEHAIPYSHHVTFAPIATKHRARNRTLSLAPTSSDLHRRGLANFWQRPIDLCHKRDDSTYGNKTHFREALARSAVILALSSHRRLSSTLTRQASLARTLNRSLPRKSRSSVYFYYLEGNSADIIPRLQRCGSSKS